MNFAYICLFSLSLHPINAFANGLLVEPPLHAVSTPQTMGAGISGKLYLETIGENSVWTEVKYKIDNLRLVRVSGQEAIYEGSLNTKLQELWATEKTNYPQNDKHKFSEFDGRPTEVIFKNGVVHTIRLLDDHLEFKMEFTENGKLGNGRYNRSALVKPSEYPLSVDNTAASISAPNKEMLTEARSALIEATRMRPVHISDNINGSVTSMVRSENGKFVFEEMFLRGKDVSESFKEFNREFEQQLRERNVKIPHNEKIHFEVELQAGQSSSHVKLASLSGISGEETERLFRDIKSSIRTNLADLTKIYGADAEGITIKFSKNENKLSIESTGNMPKNVKASIEAVLQEKTSEVQLAMEKIKSHRAVVPTEWKMRVYGKDFLLDPDSLAYERPGNSKIKAVPGRRPAPALR